jgi:hypothetical protein
MAHGRGAGDRGQRLAVRAATECRTLVVGSQLRAPAEVDPAGLGTGVSLAGAGDAVQSRHQQHIAGGEPGEYLVQLCAVGFGAARDCTVHFNRACGGQCRDLRRDALAVRGDSRIAVDHVPIMHLSFARWKGNQINHIFFGHNS